MELILEKELPHQQKAVDTICSVFKGIPITTPAQFYENPLIAFNNPQLKINISLIQKDIPIEYRGNKIASNYLNLDIKMETGTGKTYVYTKVMYELHKYYGINKFIIAVPSLAIKAGTAQFIQDEYVKRHFSDICGYDTEIEIGILEAPKNRKKGHTYFPSVVSDYIKGSCQNKKKIYVILTNMQLLTSAKILTRDDYDYGAEGFYRPLDALKATRPFVIIDEPHRFSRDQKAFTIITDEIKPQCIIRFGATFPEKSEGRGKNKAKVKDYQNLLYDLNAYESFNQNLIKGVAKEHFEPVSRRDEKVKITSITNHDSVSFIYKRRDEVSKSFTLKVEDSLSLINEAFFGIKISAIGTSTVEFSNGIVKTVGEELDVDIYMSSYQEQMIRLALERHFDTERENFCNRIYKIKTLALFFIDDISSYRPNTEGKKPYLLEAFERLLKDRIKTIISELDSHEREYKEYLEASLANISACHAGYFSKDNSDSDENVAQEVDIILHGKKQLISFKNTDGSYNTLRFLFSKWTLKEGWDNPNVFTIVKLRSSGSEISKLQEVGRGLRLPVDENGNRISNEEFHLNYIVDFTEADFATRLIEQVNGEIPQAMVISEERLTLVAKKLGITADELFDNLYSKHYIDRHRSIKPDTRDIFFNEYPDFAIGLSSSKVKDLNVIQTKPIKIRKAVYNEIRELWEKINQRYLLFYDSKLDTDMVVVALSLFEKQGVFNEVVMTSTRDVVKNDVSHMTTTTGTGVQYIINHTIPYGVFLKHIMKATNIPITVLHSAMCIYSEKHGTIETKYINDSSVTAFCSEFQNWRINNLQGRFHYKQSITPIGATALSYEDGTPRKDIAQGRIGTKITPGTPSAKYLYDTYVYDSPLEQNNIVTDISEIVVYGKIPRCSIAIPTITGGMYSPDFMYVVKRASGEKELNVIVETKDVENKSVLREEENAKIKCAEVFFDMLSQDGYKVYFRNQLNNKKMIQILNEVLSQK